MCTLILLHRCVAGAPLVAAANRDEYLDRPAAGPALRPGAAGPVVAPTDVRAGGTWLGVNAHGVFAALTNRPDADPDPERRSRGLLVLDALAAPDARTCADHLETLPAGAYNPFNLLVADGTDAFVCGYLDGPRTKSLAPGAHVVGNVDPDDVEAPKVARTLAHARAAATLPADEVLDALAACCRRHDGGGALDSVCVHTPGYGTRSATLLRLGETRGDDALLFSEGPPCRAAFQDFTHLLDALGRSAAPRAGDPIARTAI